MRPALTRIAPGYYRGTHKGRGFEVTKVEDHPNWFFQLTDERPDDWFTTRGEAVDAAVETIEREQLAPAAQGR